MRQFLIPASLVSSVLCFGSALFAAPQDNSRPYYRGDRVYGEAAPAPAVGDFRAGQMLFTHVRSDLDRAENNLPEYSNDRYRFDRVRGELSELQRNWDESSYEPGQVDAVMRTLDRALSSNDIWGRDRDRLSADLNQLRDFRDAHE
jgi:hypothetical protein